MAMLGRKWKYHRKWRYFMKRGKTIVWGLAAVMVLGALAGCAKKPVTGVQQNDTNPEKSTVASEKEALPEQNKNMADVSGNLVVWVGDQQVGIFEDIAKGFTEKTGVTVEIVPYTGVNATDKLALDGPAGNGGDVYVQGGGAALAKGVDQGLFKELADGVIDVSVFTESTIEDYRYNGALYGIPMGAETPALIYNKDLISEIPDTWEGLMEVCGAMTDIENDTYGFLMDVTNPYFANALYDANGGYIFAKTEAGYDTADIGLNNDGTKDMVKQFVSYFDQGLWQRNMAFDVMEKKFTEGRAAVIYDGPWAVAGYKEAGIDIGIAPLPKLANGNVPRTFSGSYGLAISEFTQNEAAAVEFLKYVMNEENIMAYCNATNRIPSLKSCNELDEIKNDNIRSSFAKQLESSIPQPNVPEMDLIYGPMIDALTLIISQNDDVDTTLDKAVSQIKEQISIMQQ